MAYDDLKLHFHLTPRGWIAGTRWFFGTVQEAERVRPADAVATFELHITQPSGWSKEGRTWNEIWRQSGKTFEEISALQKKFAPPDEDLDLPHE